MNDWSLHNALTLLRSRLADASAAGHRHLLQEPELLGLNPQAPLAGDLDVVQRAWQTAQGLAASLLSGAASPVPGARSLPRRLLAAQGNGLWHEQQWQVRMQLLLERLSC